MIISGFECKAIRECESVDGFSSRLPEARLSPQVVTQVDLAFLAVKLCDRDQSLLGQYPHRSSKTGVCAHDLYAGVPVRRGVPLYRIPKQATWLSPVSGADCELLPEFASPDRPFHIDCVLSVLVVEEPFIVSFHRSHEGVGHPYGDVGVANRVPISFDLAEIKHIGMGIRNRDH